MLDGTAIAEYSMDWETPLPSVGRASGVYPGNAVHQIVRLGLVTTRSFTKHVRRAWNNGLAGYR